MILLTFALPHESGRIVPLLENRTRLEGGALPAYSGTLEGQPAVILHTGMGPKRAEARSREYLDQIRPKVVIAAGYGGGLDARLVAGSLVLAENFSHPELLSVARQSAQKTHPNGAIVGKLSTQPEVAASVAEKKALARATGAIAVDMETEAIFLQCAQREIPVLAVRAISDSVETPMPVPGSVWFDEAAQEPRVLSLLAYLAKNPGRIAPFAGFVRGTGIARKELTVFLREFVQGL